MLHTAAGETLPSTTHPSKSDAQLGTDAPAGLEAIRIRRAKPVPADIQATADLGRYVFEATFAWQTTPEDMALYLETAYSYAAVEQVLLDPARQMYVAEIPDGVPLDSETGFSSTSGVEAGNGIDSQNVSFGSGAYPPPGSAPPSAHTRTPIAAFLSLSTDSAEHEPCLAPYPSPLEIRTIYVHPAYQGCGLAGRMIGVAKQAAVAQGFSSLWLGVYPGNGKAIRFYEKNGFRKVGTHEFLLGGQVDIDDVMVMRLDGGGVSDE